MFFGVIKLIQMTGRFTGEFLIISTLVLPSMNRNMRILVSILKGSFLVHFELTNFMITFSPHQIHSGSGLDNHPSYICIYSLRHFLTTKGALINGKQGGSKNYPKTQKSDQNFLKKIKMTKN